MSYFKKFTDFFLGIAAFVATLFLIRKYMSFEPDELLLEEQSKLSQFIEYRGTDVTMYLHMLFFFALALAAAIILRRLPYICLIFNLPPIIYASFMFGEEILYEQTALFLIASALPVIGNLAECAWRDREDGHHRLFLASKISSALGALTCFAFYWLAKNPPDKETLPISDMNTFEKAVYAHTNPSDVGEIAIIACLFIGVFVIGLILYNVYFVDALLSLVPLVYCFYSVLSGKLMLAPLVFVALSLVCATANIMLAVCENNLSRKEQSEVNS